VRLSATSRAATFASVTTQGDQACAITTDAYLYCWGQHEGKMLGLGPEVTVQSVLTPTPVAGDHRWTQVDLGMTSCGIDTEQRGWCWSYNAFGTTGSGVYTEYVDTPIAVAGNLRFRYIGTASYDACGLTVEGATYCWGPNYWGIGGGTTQSSVPRRLAGDPGFTSISMGDNFACGLTAVGQAYCWGANFHKQLGVGDATLEICDASTGTQCARTPQPVATDLRFRQVVAGTFHACGLVEDGAAYCWGDNDHTQLGDGTQTVRSTPTLAVNTGRYQALDPDGFSTCGVTTAGAVECWGQAYGGLPVTMDACAMGGGAYSGCWITPRNIAAGWTFQAGPTWGRGNSFCGLSAGVLYCWGYNGRGDVGDGTTVDRPTPVKVAGQP
jgi:alpha-tubulin suppressor-like RCC1 family protein